MNLIEHFYEQQSLRTKEEVEALDQAALSLARISSMASMTPDELADLPPHLR